MEKRRDSKGRILNTGETQEPDGSYVYRYEDQMGKRCKLRSWRLTESDATPYHKKYTKPLRDMEQDITIQAAKGIYSDNTTVSDLVNRYVQLRTGVRPGTMTGYKTVQNLLEKNAFGRKQIDKVKYSDAKLFLVRLQSEGRSYSSIHTVRGVLRPAFQMAVEDEMINYNPFNFELGKLLINDSVQREAISPEDERKFLKFVQDDPHFRKYYEGIYILFNTGLRISEFCGLTKSDVDLKGKTLNVDHQLQRITGGKYAIASPKTNAGKRVLPINDDVCDCFRTIFKNRKKPKVEPMIDGKTGFLYLDKNDMPLLAMHWEKYFQRICEKYNSIYKVQLPKITPHVCRHTYCTNMAKSGISAKTLQYLMGHSDIGVTLNVYTHLGLADAQHELEKLEAEQEMNTSKTENHLKQMSRRKKA